MPARLSGRGRSTLIGFGKAPLVVSAGVTAEHLAQDCVRKLSLEDLEAMTAILQKYSPDAAEIAKSDAAQAALPAAR